MERWLLPVEIGSEESEWENFPNKSQGKWEFDDFLDIRRFHMQNIQNALSEILW